MKDENSVYNNYVSQYCGVVLRRIRKNNNLTGADLAKILNISQQQVSRYERGVTKFTVDMLLSMSIALNVSFESIIKSIIAEIKISKIDDAITLKAKTSIFDTAHFY
ncbi:MULTISPECIES: helix-turn-helix domain-containing protein [unclassified Providencia]|uniref:helix-turn-helix domain-containing protein n=1 Tax=unclassified Providencia TaxID=2633465 RepID=UPI00234A15B7|nr:MULTISPECIES: helix-turn-helix transcriptional regulator [unclassified Providencia]